MGVLNYEHDIQHLDNEHKKNPYFKFNTNDIISGLKTACILMAGHQRFQGNMFRVNLFIVPKAQKKSKNQISMIKYIYL